MEKTPEWLADTDSADEQQPPLMKVAKTALENAERIIEIDKEIDDLSAAIAKLELERKDIEEALKAQFSDSEVQNIKLKGKTVYIKGSLYCNVKGENMQAIIEVLDKHGMQDIAPRLATTAKIKALLNEDEALWKERFGELVNTGKLYQIVTRSS